MSRSISKIRVDFPEESTLEEMAGGRHHDPLLE